MQKSLVRNTPQFSLFLALIFLGISCGKNESGRSHMDLTNGITIDSSTFPAVVLLLNPETDQFCTGFFVNEHQVLTAGHCVNELEQSNPELYIVEPQKSDTGKYSFAYQAKALQVLIHPDFERGKMQLVNPSDLSIVEFPVGSAPASLRLARQSPKVKDTVTLIGFGDSINSVSSTLSQVGTGEAVKRYGQNTLQSVNNGTLSISGLPRTKANIKEGQYVSTGLGDSGSPLLVNGLLVGLTVAGEVRQASNGLVTSFSYSLDLNASTSRAFLNTVLD